MPRQPHKKRTEALEHRRQDDTACLREWRRWRSEEVSRAIAGPHGAIIRTLIETCRAAPLWSDIEPAQVLAPFAGLGPGHARSRPPDSEQLRGRQARGDRSRATR
jgi:hypothetical protein